MLNRIILSIIVFASLCWITYNALQILGDDNNLAPETLFGTQDASILIINRPTEFTLSAAAEFEVSPATEIWKLANDSAYNQCFLSLTKAHLLFTKKTPWSEEDVLKLFRGSGIKIENGQVELNGYTGKFHLKNLYLSKEVHSSKNNSIPFIYDKKASASIITLKVNNGVYATTDIYFNSDGIANYITKDENLEDGKKQADEVLFSGIISKNISCYHFYEREYLKQFDSIYANGPLFQWLDVGFVEVKSGGKTAIIADYIAGQDPFWILDEFSKTMDTSWYSVPLTSSFPEKGKKYKVEYLEDFVVISSSEETCKKLISDYKLGQTIALSDVARSKYYSQLPKYVSERFVDEQNQSSKSVYHGKLMESNASIKIAKKLESKKESVTISIGSDIKDFYPLNKDGDVIVLTETGEISRYADGKQKWQVKANGIIISPIQAIDLHATGETHYLINTSQEIHLLDATGNESTGFPVKLEQDASNAVKFYRWREKSYFLQGLANNSVLHLDAKGREINIIKTKFTVTEKIDVWASQKRLFAGFAHDGEFIMYDLDQNKNYREFITPMASTRIKVPNELFHFGIKNGELIKVDQKGLEFDMGNLLATKVIEIENNKLNSIAIQNNNDVKLLNINGIPFAELRLPFNEIDAISIYSTESGKTLVGVIDGLENNVYLYTADGQLKTSKGLEGQRKLSIDSSGKGYRITTIVDQFVVQYFEN